jgi:hypothetical protein
MSRPACEPDNIGHSYFLIALFISAVGLVLTVLVFRALILAGGF